MNPMARLKVMIRPKWIGSIPSKRTVGISRGTSTMIAALPSMNMPRISRKAFSKVKD